MNTNMLGRQQQRQALKSREAARLLELSRQKRRLQNNFLMKKTGPEQTLTIRKGPISPPKGVNKPSCDRKLSKNPYSKDKSGRLTEFSKFPITTVESSRLHTYQNESKGPLVNNFTPVEAPKGMRARIATHAQAMKQRMGSPDVPDNMSRTQKCQTEKSTVESFGIHPNSYTSNSRHPGKTSILQLKNKLIAESSTNPTIAQTGNDTKNRARSTAHRSTSRDSHFNINSRPSGYNFRIHDKKEERADIKKNDEVVFFKLDQLCWKKAESVADTESDRFSEIDTASFIFHNGNHRDAGQGSWASSLNEVFQKRQQKMKTETGY